jgi:type IV secretory pathway VirB2 component (pilin)
VRYRNLVIAAALVTAAALVCPHLACAADAGGGGMPYSTGLATFKTSVTGEVAGIICLIAVIAGVAAYLLQGVMDHMMMTIVRVIIGVCIIGGAATFLTTMGVAGAIIR